MKHKYSVGQNVYYEPHGVISAAGGVYTIVARLPIESDSRHNYRIKSAVESFVRTADEDDLSPTD